MLWKSFVLAVFLGKLNYTADARSCWRTTNSFKKNTNKVGGKVAAAAWVEYFENLLNPPLLSAPVGFAKPYVRDDFLDADFLITDLKTNKAPGFDRVPDEFFYCVTDDFIDMLITTYNNIHRSGSVP